jgi:hypothetical protein
MRKEGGREERGEEAVRRACEGRSSVIFVWGLTVPLTSIDQLCLNPQPSCKPHPCHHSAITQVTLLAQINSKWYHRDFT